MKVTSVRIRIPDGKLEDPKIKLLAYVTIEIDNVLKLSHLRVIINQYGKRVVEMPSRRSHYGDYINLVHPITEELRSHLRSSVLDEVKKHIPE